MVVTEACPRSSCTDLTSAPPSSRWVANECRRVCGEIGPRSGETPGLVRGVAQHLPRRLARQSAAADVEEHRVVALPARGQRGPAAHQVGGKGRGRERAHRHHPLLGTLAAQADRGHSLTRQVVDVEPDRLTDPRAGRIQELQQRTIAERAWIVTGRRFQDGGDQLDGQRLRQPFTRGRRMDIAGRVAGGGRFGEQESVPATDRDHGPSRGRRRERRVALPALPQGDEVGTDVLGADVADGVDTADRTERQVPLEVPAVGKQRVASHTALDGQVIEITAQRSPQLRGRLG